jgi:hypothetical protein
MLLALGSFLAGLNLASLELCFLGLVLALAVPAVSWVKQSMLFVILAGAFVVGIWHDLLVKSERKLIDRNEPFRSRSDHRTAG